MTIKWGIIGCGKIAHKFIQDFEFVNNGEVIAVGSRSPQKAEAFAAQYNVKKAYGSYEALAADSEVEAIYIATPHTFHLENMKLCFEHDKAVLCEKPIAVNAKELEEALQMAKTKNLFLMEAMWTWFLPAVLKAREWITQGRIGAVKFLRADFGFKAEFDKNSRIYNPELAAGALLDIGIYPLSIAEFLIDSPIKKIQSVGYLGSTKVDEYNAMSVEYDNGVFAQLSSGVISDMNNDAYIVGTKGYICLRNFWRSKKVVLETPEGKDVFEEILPCHGYNYETEHVNQLLLAGKKESPVVTHEHSRKSMERMDELRKEWGLKYPFE